MGLQAFLSDSDIVSMTDAQAEAAALAAYSLPIDTTAYTYSGLAQQFLGYMQAGWLPNMTTDIIGNSAPLIRAIVYNPGTGNQAVGQTLDAMLTSGGYDFGTAAHRAIISAWTPGAPPDAVTLINAMLFVGAPTCPRWQAPQYGISSAPSQSDIAAARATMLSQSTITRITNAWTVVSNAMAAGTVTTYAQAVTLFGEQ